MVQMKQLRTVDTPFGPIVYTLQRKRVKNLNLRVGRTGSVSLSIPFACPDDRADCMVLEKSDWITNALARRISGQEPPLPQLSPEECRKRLEGALERVYPLIEPLGVAKPALKIRAMKSQWGNCHWRQGYITLNSVLAACPAHLQEYVTLHELVHFLHPNHGAGFYARMDALMPQWRLWRKELRGDFAALIFGS